MAYPEEYGIDFEDWGRLRIVRIADRLPTHNNATCRPGGCPDPPSAYGDRSEWRIRKVIIHHHAGRPHDTNPKQNGGAMNGLPRACITTANFFIAYDPTPADNNVTGRHWAGFAYHYDIPYHDEVVDGQLVVYETQLPTKVSYHTGGAANTYGIGISMIGHLRALGSPTGAAYSPNAGEPSAHQRAAVPELVRYLQDKYGVSNLHVQGHFQHGKLACPGYDFELWTMEHEEEDRRNGRAFCYPIALTGNQPPFLQATANENARACDYMANTRTGGSGFYPFGRRPFWHNGVHLFPPGGEGSPVYAVRDGWIVGARFNGQVVVDGIDYGSSSFVLMQHEDPGLFDPHDSRSYHGGRQYQRFLTYWSLYMHLQPPAGNLTWINELQHRDRARYDQMNNQPEVARHFGEVAIPVKAGDIIGHVGAYRPFAGRPADAPAPAQESVYAADKHAVLHFEMFAIRNPIADFDDDRQVSNRWLIHDGDRNALSENAAARLAAVAGLRAINPQIVEMMERVARADPHLQDASAWTAELTPEIDNALSKLITRHVSEWGADWNAVINHWFRIWGLAENRVHASTVANTLKWWSQLLVNERGYPMQDTGLTVNARPFFYHPIRFLNWLNGLRRVLDAPQSGDIHADLPTTNARLSRDAAQGAITVYLPSAIARNRIENSSLRFDGSTRVYRVTGVAAVPPPPGTRDSREWEVTLDPALDRNVTRRTALKLGNYGWHWESDFSWETDLI